MMVAEGCALMLSLFLLLLWMMLSLLFLLCAQQSAVSQNAPQVSSDELSA
jgi:hypothetical protein